MGDHVGRGTITRGDSRTHLRSAVDPDTAYPTPTEVNLRLLPKLDRQLTQVLLDH